MAVKTIIQQFLAALLLLVFSFSITPKKFLHDAIANHHDKIVVTVKDSSPQVNHTGFICKCDNLVAESPFTDASTRFSFVSPQIFLVQPAFRLYHFFSSPVFYSGLRGPPVHTA